MKVYLLAMAFLASLTLVSCDDSTAEIGVSLIEKSDLLDVSTDSFKVESKSILAGSILGKSHIGYLGRIKDPETGDFVTSSFMSQVATIEGYTFPKEELIQNKKDGKAQADSCFLNLFFTTFYGDSLAPLKINVQELAKVLPETSSYYSDFDLAANGYLRENGINKSKMCTLTDLTVSDSLRSSSRYDKHLQFDLNDPYTDKDGQSYSNFGTYILQTYYKHPEYFKNSQMFRSHVVHGFNFSVKSGLGAMAYIANVQLNIYLTDKEENGNGKNRVALISFPGTEEILQTSKIVNDTKRLQQLVEDKSCCYIKTPAGIFTELTLPVEDIVKGHEKDSINSAKIVLQRINNNGVTEFNLPVPTQLLMLPKDSLKSFFENGSINDNINSYVVSRDYISENNRITSYKNTYTFSNISGLIKAMAKARQKNTYSADWNKVVIIPVTTTTASINNVTYTTAVRHNMALTSTRLVGGADNPNAPLKISIIYSKFK